MAKTKQQTKRPVGKPPSPARALRRAADGTAEIKISGIPDTLLEAMERYVAKHKLRGRNTLIGMCAIEGFKARQEAERENRTAAVRGA